MKTPIQLVPLRFGLYCLMVMALCALVPAQNRQAVPATGATAPTEGPDAFDVVSLKASPQQAFTPGISTCAGMFRVPKIERNPTSFYGSCVAVIDLMIQAYNVRPFQILGLPKWAQDVGYDVQAKTAEPVSPEKMRSLVAALLAEKFKLWIGRETKEMAGYNLVVGKGGPKMAPGGIGDMDLLANIVSTGLHTKVANQTGLEGRYRLPIPTPPAPGDNSPRPSGPLEFWDTALASAGLRLVPAKMPVEFILVEGVEPPASQ
jgi:hypothetical protein